MEEGGAERESRTSLLSPWPRESSPGLVLAVGEAAPSTPDLPGTPLTPGNSRHPTFVSLPRDQWIGNLGREPAHPMLG